MVRQRLHGRAIKSVRRPHSGTSAKIAQNATYETIGVVLSRGFQAGRGGWPGFAGFSGGRCGAVMGQNGEAAHSGHQSAKI